MADYGTVTLLEAVYLYINDSFVKKLSNPSRIFNGYNNNPKMDPKESAIDKMERRVKKVEYIPTTTMK